MTIKDIIDPIGKALNWFYTTEDGLSVVMVVVFALVIFKLLKRL
jgi:hypothetical protein